MTPRAPIGSPTRAYDSRLDDLAENVLGYRADIRGLHWAGHQSELQGNPNDQLGANYRGSAYLSSRNSAHYDFRDYESRSCDGGGSQGDACDPESFSSDGDGGQNGIDPGAGSSDDAAAAPRRGACIAGANTQWANTPSHHGRMRK